MKNVAITRIGGYLGGLLLDRLGQEDEVERIIGLDIKEPGVTSSKLKFYQQDVRKPFADIFIDNEIDTACTWHFRSRPFTMRQGLIASISRAHRTSSKPARRQEQVNYSI